MTNDSAIVWFRNDLRVHDNEALTKAIANAGTVLPVYIFDERVFKGKTKFGFAKTDVYRAQFVIESVHNLRHKLKQIGLDLLVRVGKPEDELFDLAKEMKSSWIFANRERTQEEIDVQDTLEIKLWTIGQEMSYTRGKMLYYTSDLPFPITHTPDVFTQFRKEVEKFINVRPPLSIPNLNYCNLPVNELDYGDIPNVEDFGHDASRLSTADVHFKGGEDAALRQLKHYLWESDAIATYKETRNDLIGWDFSTKFSPYLAQGCLSPKLIYHEVRRYEKERTKNGSTYWVIFELMWRDFFRLMGKKFGNRIFLEGGLNERLLDLTNDMGVFSSWANGTTGIPFIDANMRQLNQTGFMSNRGRQNVASYLVHDLKINWLIGAEYFESLLLDYDPCSNYGNWNYISGVGNDPREDRCFNIAKQAHRYDPDGAFIKSWIPELNEFPLEKLHNPAGFEEEIQSKYNVNLGEAHSTTVA